MYLLSSYVGRHELEPTIRKSKRRTKRQTKG